MKSLNKTIVCAAFAAAALTAWMFFRWYFMGSFIHTVLVFSFCLWVVAPASIGFALVFAHQALHSRNLQRNKDVPPSKAFSPRVVQGFSALWAFAIVMVAGVFLGDALYAKADVQARIAALLLNTVCQPLPKAKRCLF
jgi:hypothetical protein